jgi:hypothetical protein
MVAKWQTPLAAEASNPKTLPAPPTMPVPAFASTIESRLGRSHRHAR